MDPVTLALLGAGVSGLASGASGAFFGSGDKHSQRPRLSKKQRPLFDQLLESLKNPGAGGAFGTSADYYRDLLSNDSQTMEQLSAPEMRKFNEEIIPGLSEQFAGMGAGGLSSSGFRNAQVQGATDLAERLGSIRANLRQAGAQGLQNIGQVGLQNYSQNMVTQPGTEGFLSSVAPAIGGAIGTAVGGPLGGMLGGMAGNWFGGSGQKVGANSSPYGGSPKASPGGGGFQLPNFLQGQRGF